MTSLCFAEAVIVLAGSALGAKPYPDGAQTREICVAVDNPAACTATWPLGFGVALKEGQAPVAAGFRLVDATDREVPSSFEVRARWNDGSVKWLWCDFLDRPAADGYALVWGEPATSAAALNVAETDDGLTVDNGALTVRWNKQFAAPKEIALQGGEGRRTIIGQGSGDGVYFITTDERRAVLGGPQADLAWEVETRNPLRVVVRVEGWYVDGRGERVGRAVLRYHFYKDLPWLKLEHTFIVTADNDEQAYREIGVTMPFNGAARNRATFGVAEGEPWGADVAGSDEAFVCQTKYPIYNRPDEFQCVAGLNGRATGEFRSAAGWSDVHNGAVGLTTAVREMAIQFPKELAVSAHGSTARLWSGRDGKRLDYLPATQAEQWWGDWTERFLHTKETYVLTEWLKIPDVPTLKAQKWSAVGAARTHELYFRCYEGDFDAGATAAWTQTIENPPLALVDPYWMTRVDERIIWPMTVKGEGGEKYADVERLISTWFDGHMQLAGLFPWTGWFDFGKASELKYERMPDGRINAQWYRLDNIGAYNINAGFFYAWIRSGERKYYDAARRYNRFIADNKIIHWGGGKQQKRRGMFTGFPGAMAPWYWYGPGHLTPGSRNILLPLALEYYLHDARHGRDCIRLTTDAFINQFTVSKATCGTSPDVIVDVMCTCYEMHPDERLAKKMADLFALITDPSAEGGLSLAYFDKTSGEGTPGYKAERKAANLIHYAELTGRPEHKAIVRKLWEHWGRRYIYSNNDDGPLGYQRYIGAIAARLYEWYGDESFLADMRWQLDGARKIFAAYEALPEEKRGLPGLLKKITAPGSSQPSPFVFEGLGIEYAKQTNLSFGCHTNIAPLTSLPAAMYVLQRVER